MNAYGLFVTTGRSFMASSRCCMATTGTPMATCYQVIYEHFGPFMASSGSFMDTCGLFAARYKLLISTLGHLWLLRFKRDYFLFIYYNELQVYGYYWFIYGSLRFMTFMEFWYMYGNCHSGLYVCYEHFGLFMTSSGSFMATCHTGSRCMASFSSFIIIHRPRPLWRHLSICMVYL